MRSPEGYAFYSGEEAQQYYILFRICHDLVISYLDANPEVANKWGQPGYRYYDVLKLASPLYNQKVREWSEDFQKRKIKYEERFKKQTAC